MDSVSSKRRTKPGAFPGKFKSFVNDVKKFRVHRHERKESQEVLSVGSSPALIPQPFQPSQASEAPISISETTVPEINIPDIDDPEIDNAEIDEPEVNIPKIETPEPKLLSSSQSSLPVASLAVQVTITFDEPLNYSYSRSYETSSDFLATDALCQGLLRRVDHCCYELITRKDSTAMEYAAASGSDKPLRYEIQIDIIRGWSEIWSSRTFKSYQKQALSNEAAREIITSTHHIIGLFLKHHDQDFVMKEGFVREDPLDEQAKFPHRAGRVQPMSCVPRSHFLEKSQSFESLPGYTINFSFTSRCQRRKPHEWHTKVKVDSNQAAPLNSIGAENLFFEASYALDGVLRSEREMFRNKHSKCMNLDGCKDCRHHDNDGLELQISIVNNLGPQFLHLERTVHCSSNLSFYTDTEKCVTFTNQVEVALAKVRDDADEVVSRMNDLEFRITELRGYSWALDEPLIFTLPSSDFHSRRDIEAILDRIQAGVAEILRGNAISVRMTAHKRGHFILDKTFVAREPLETEEKKKTKSIGKPKDYVLKRLQQRVERAIEMVCKDTLTIDDAEEKDKDTGKEASILEQRPLTRDTRNTDAKTFISRPDTAGSTSQNTTEQHKASSYLTTDAEAGAVVPSSKSVIENEHPRPFTPTPEATPKAHSAPPSPTHRPPIPIRRSSMVLYYSKTGARAFPLVPWAHSYGELEGLGGRKSQQDIFGQQETNNLLRKPSTLTFQQSVLKPEESEGKGAAVMASQEKGVESTPIYEHSIASTPSLVFGGDSSPGSSLLITPKKHRLSTEVDYSKNAIADSDDEDVRESVGMSMEAQQDLRKSQLFRTPSPQLTTKPTSSSPLRVSETIQSQSSISLSESDKVSLKNSTKPINSKPNQKPLVNGVVKTPVVATPTAPVDEKYLNTRNTTTRSESSNEDTFAQSKPDFTFSSPPAATPEGGNSEGEESFQPRQRESSPDPSEDLDMSLSQESQQQARGSFGSAGVLGFHEQMFGSLSLRTALMRHRPSSNFDVAEPPREEKRPGTAV
ncbi:putative pt repeat family protein [Daldinia childiae]|uniref:putative pt repeat family protein n=1 Tax=Daldinia childiae TaxID=326645 RepID=UPI0014455690|nr:putative pt repeat family protein [Daldinia childiae]KAF3056609.1 putative pt repeat family protein [Daldinia childiae]